MKVRIFITKGIVNLYYGWFYIKISLQFNPDFFTKNFKTNKKIALERNHVSLTVKRKSVMALQQKFVKLNWRREKI